MKRNPMNVHMERACKVHVAEDERVQFMYDVMVTLGTLPENPMYEWSWEDAVEETRRAMHQLQRKAGIMDKLRNTVGELMAGT